MWRDWRATWEVWRWEISGVHRCGRSRRRVRRGFGRGRDGGVPVEANISQVTTVHRGRIVHYTLFQTRSEALEAVGLSEQDAHRWSGAEEEAKARSTTPCARPSLSRMISFQFRFEP